MTKCTTTRDTMTVIAAGKTTYKPELYAALTTTSEFKRIARERRKRLDVELIAWLTKIGIPENKARKFTKEYS